MENLYLVFIGEVNQINVAKITEKLTAAIASKCGCVQLLIQTSGGSVADGVFLHHFIKSYPFKLITYNIGSISSAGVTIFLGAKERIATTGATFMIHKTSSPPISATAEIARNISVSTTIDDERTESILRNNITLSDTEWTTLQHYPLWIDTQAALKIGLITSIGIFSPKDGAMILSVGA